MRDVAQRLAQERQHGIRVVVAFEGRVPHQGAHAHPLVGDGDGVEAGDAVDVDEVTLSLLRYDSVVARRMLSTGMRL